MKFEKDGSIALGKLVQVTLGESCRARLEKLVNAEYRRIKPGEQVTMSALVSAVIERLMDRRDK